MIKENSDYLTQIQHLKQMKLMEEFYHHNETFTYDVYKKILGCYMERYGVGENELYDEFEDGEKDINWFIDDYLNGLLTYLRFEDEITSICLGDVFHTFTKTMSTKFIIARYYGINIQSNDEYLEFRDKLNDEDLEEFYSVLTSNGIKVDGHTLVGVEFD